MLGLTAVVLIRVRKEFEVTGDFLIPLYSDMGMDPTPNLSVQFILGVSKPTLNILRDIKDFPKPALGWNSEVPLYELAEVVIWGVINGYLNSTYCAGACFDKCVQEYVKECEKENREYRL